MTLCHFDGVNDQGQTCEGLLVTANIQQDQGQARGHSNVWLWGLSLTFVCRLDQGMSNDGMCLLALGVRASVWSLML